MRTIVAVGAVVVLLVLALVPWIVVSCVSQPLVPEALVQERAHYEATVDTARAATMVAQRSGESDRSVIVIGTLAPTAARADALPLGGPVTALPAASGTAAPPASISPSPTPSIIPTATETPTARPTSIVTIRLGTNGPTPTAITRVIVVQSSDATPVPLIPVIKTDTPLTPGSVVPSVSGTPIAGSGSAMPASNTPTVAVPRPANLVDVEDVITEQMLNEQVQQEADSATISNMQIELTPDGIHARGSVSVFLGLRRPIEMRGTFMVQEERLVVVVDSIIFEGRDVTERYRGTLEERVNWGLYRLLPQRYVRSYELTLGQLKVRSQMRRQ